VLALLAFAEGVVVKHKIVSGSPDETAPLQTKFEHEDGTVEINVRLPSSEYEPDDTIAASEVLRDQIQSIDHENELIHEGHELGEEEIAKFIDVPVGVAIIAALFLGAVVARMKFGWLPESAITIGVGVCLGIWMKTSIGFIPFFLDEEHFNETCSTLLNLFLLPILMFEAGWSMRYKDFASQFNYILLFAIFGSLMSFIAVGCLILKTGQLGLAFGQNASHCIRLCQLDCGDGPGGHTCDLHRVEGGFIVKHFGLRRLYLQ
jgi:sodium/hydrogen exchanger 8